MIHSAPNVCDPFCRPETMGNCEISGDNTISMCSWAIVRMKVLLVINVYLILFLFNSYFEQVHVVGRLLTVHTSPKYSKI